MEQKCLTGRIKWCKVVKYFQIVSWVSEELLRLGLNFNRGSTLLRLVWKCHLEPTSPRISQEIVQLSWIWGALKSVEKNHGACFCPALCQQPALCQAACVASEFTPSSLIWSRPKYLNFRMDRHKVCTQFWLPKDKMSDMVTVLCGKHVS